MELFYKSSITNEYYSVSGVIFRHEIKCDSNNHGYSFYYHHWFMWSVTLNSEIPVPTLDRDTADMIRDYHLRPVSRSYARMIIGEQRTMKIERIGKGVLLTYED